MRTLLLESVMKIRALPADINLIEIFSEKYKLQSQATLALKLEKTRLEIANEKAKIINTHREEVASKNYHKEELENYTSSEDYLNYLYLFDKFCVMMG